MYLNTDLSEIVNYKSINHIIFVVEDKISKICHYIISSLDIRVKKLAKVIKQEVIRLNKVLLIFISDRGPLLIS